MEHRAVRACAGSTRRSGRPGRRGDFLTSPEVGPLFGAVVAGAPRRRVGAPRASSSSSRWSTRAPARARSPGRCWPPTPACVPRALRYVAVEVSAGPAAASTRTGVESPDGAASAGPIDGVVLANELLDNLPFRLAVHDGGCGREAFVIDGARRRVQPRCSPTGSTRRLAVLPPRPPHRREGADPGRVPDGGWSRPVRSSATASVVAVDYARPATAEMALLPWRAWLRTYSRPRAWRCVPRRPRGSRTSRPTSPSTSCPSRHAVRVSGAVPPALRHAQELVEEGRAAWAGAAAARRPGGGADARAGAVEAEALLDPAGLGGFTVLEWECPALRRGAPSSFGRQEEVEWRIPAERRQQVAGW